MDKSKINKEKNYKSHNTLRIIVIIFLVLILSCLYLLHRWNKHEDMQVKENLKLAESIASLLHTDHIEMLTSYDNRDIELVGYYLEESLVNLVETTDSIYYAYLLKEEVDGVKIVVDSSKAESGTSKPIRRTCEEAEEVNKLAFENKEALIAEPVTTECGSWVRSLTPLYNMEKDLR